MDATLPTSRWFALSCTDWGERKAARSLARFDIDTFLPTMRTERQHRRTKRWVIQEHLLIPGYLFVELLPTFRDWRLIKSCAGVTDVLGISVGEGREPYPMPVGFVERLQDMQANLEFDDTRDAKIRRREIGRNRRETTMMRFPIGSRVRAKDGPFATFHGLVTNVNARGEVEALVEFMGRMVPVGFYPEQVESEAA